MGVCGRVIVDGVAVTTMLAAAAAGAYEMTPVICDEQHLKNPSWNGQV